MTKQIHLTQGKNVLVDDGDYELVSQYKRYLFPNGDIGFYAHAHTCGVVP